MRSIIITHVLLSHHHRVGGKLPTLNLLQAVHTIFPHMEGDIKLFRVFKQSQNLRVMFAINQGILSVFFIFEVDKCKFGSNLSAF